MDPKLHWEPRDFLILPLPKHLKENVMRKAVSGTQYAGVAKDTKIRTQFYYRSTGTSTNDVRYANVWFPSFGVSEVDVPGPRGKPITGWIQKAGIYDVSRQTKWRNAFCSQFWKQPSWDKCLKGVEQTKVLKFFERFGRWFHVQQSAALGGGLWEEEAFMGIRDFALSHSFDPKTSKFFEDPSIVQFYAVKEPCHRRQWTSNTYAKLLNDELAQHGALFTRIYDRPTTPLRSKLSHSPTNSRPRSN